MWLSLVKCLPGKPTRNPKPAVNDCDEVHPSCGNCLKHGVSCDFEGSASPPVNTPAVSIKRADEPPIPASSTSSHMPQFQPSPRDIMRANPPNCRLLELKLLHNFTVSTSKTISNSDNEQHTWSVDIPSMAYECQYLMDAILAVSAVHLRSSHPEDQNLIRASHSYMASALAEYSSLLKTGVSELNAEALFSTSALIAFQASASRYFEESAKMGGGGYSLPLAWFHSFQGVKTVVMASWQWIRNSDRVYPIINAQPPIILSPDPRRISFFASLLEGIEDQLQNIEVSKRDETRQAYEHSVSFLNWAHRKPDRSRVLSFAATVSRRFVELLGEYDPRALVIIACFFAMTKMVEDTWWLEGVAKREVMGIFSLLPQEWWGKMEWAIGVANCEGEVDEGVWGVSGSTQEEKFTGSVTAHIDVLAQIMASNAPPLG
ncbi:hypothetical protein B7494_g8046 [Chlorociboria aeruginascens]|nr:hypothetical protein B7494_g8046 [Chlorociboria aeruginascens]